MSFGPPLLLEPGWKGETTCYIHRGRTFIQGLIHTDPAATGDVAVIPAAKYCPAHPVIMQCPCQVRSASEGGGEEEPAEFSSNPALWLPKTFVQVEVKPPTKEVAVGRIVLTGALPIFVSSEWIIEESLSEWWYQLIHINSNGEILSGSEEHLPLYTEPFVFILNLSGLTWPLASVKSDLPPLAAVPPEDVLVTNAGLEFNRHGSRYHLGGGVRIAGGENLSPSADRPPSLPLYLFDNLPDTFTFDVEGPAVAEIEGDPVTVIAEGEERLVRLEEDPLIAPEGQDPAYIVGTHYRLGTAIGPGPRGGYMEAHQGEYAEGFLSGAATGVCAFEACVPHENCVPIGEILFGLPLASAHVSADSATLLSALPIAPDWGFVEIGVFAVTEGHAEEPFCKKIPCEFSTCNVGPVRVLLNVSFEHVELNIGEAGWEPIVVYTEENEISEPAGSGEADRLWTGFLRPPTSEYEGYGDAVDHPRKRSKELLWSVAQLEELASVQAQWVETFASNVYLSIVLKIVPVHTVRQDGYRNGTPIDFTKTGWPCIPFAEPPELGNPAKGKVINGVRV